MEKIEIEVDDKGNIGTLPEPVQKFLDTRINDAVRRKAESLEKEYKPRLRSEADEERLKLLADENARFKEEEAKRKGDHEEAKRLAEERHTAALKERDDKLAATAEELTRRESRLRSMLGSEIKAAAVAAGARDQSIPELVKLLGADIDLDPTSLEPFVKGADGKPKTDKDGKTITVEGFVAQYLADNPHHLGGTRGKGGRASGGQHMRGGQGTTEFDQSLAAAEADPSTKNVAVAVSAMRKKAGA
jgi:hypothetical protein